MLGSVIRIMGLQNSPRARWGRYIFIYNILYYVYIYIYDPPHGLYGQFWSPIILMKKLDVIMFFCTFCVRGTSALVAKFGTSQITS
jgi:hypothetical protein